MNITDSFTRIRLIAGTTFLEAVRQKFFNSLLLISIALVASSTFFQQFDFGTGELNLSLISVLERSSSLVRFFRSQRLRSFFLMRWKTVLR